MYRQILIQKDQQDFQRIWWRDSVDGIIKCYKLCTVTYGTACAPYLATRVLNKLADDEKFLYPEASAVLRRDFYVDDVLTGSDTILEAEALKKELIALLNRGGFELRKFASNYPTLSSDEVPHSKSISILGLNWQTHTDNFTFEFNKFRNVSSSNTKRSVLSEICQLFDPLGLCGPVILTAKCFMQSLWATPKLAWDSILSALFSEKWNEFKDDLSSLDQLSIPRCVISQPYSRIELHGFGDASEKGFGCAIYIRVCGMDGSYYVRLLCAKSRVAPLKQQTMPRLELCAALLLSQVMSKIMLVMDIQFDDVFYWSDSEITLYRVKGSPSKYTTFVANRITQVQELSETNKWYYVSSAMNPADLISRGLMPKELKTSKIWWEGPEYLLDSQDKWPKFPKSKIDVQLLELRKETESFSCKVVEYWYVFSKYSSFNRLLRIVARCLEFVRLCRAKIRPKPTEVNRSTSKKFSHISALHLTNAIKALVKNVQSTAFKDDIAHIVKLQSVAKNSSLKALVPFLDNEGILRVGGRLKKADIPYESQHQMLLPSEHPFTKLLVHSEHHRQLHSGPQSLLYHLRQQYWILSGRKMCRKIVNECVRCVRTRPQLLNQIMGQLPFHRVNPSRPFLVVGIDFCGPFHIVPKLRSKTTLKVYVAVFVCFATKAVHLELVGDLSTDAFIASFRRFVARRGLCAHVYSDNATNFVGARAELTEMHRLFTSELHLHDVLRYCANEQIEWHSIPPRSPHFGGLWEAAVKMAKHHMRRVVGQMSYLYEELHTLIVQIEACLNSRPLSPMSSDPSDPSCLTPGHFLIGQPINSLPDPSLEHLDFNRLSRYQKLQAMLQLFWKRWTTEYLSELQPCRKWSSEVDNVKLGTIVILNDVNTPPLKWKLGRIEKIHPGHDGKIRVVTVRTAESRFDRAITEISILPVVVDSPA